MIPVAAQNPAALGHTGDVIAQAPCEILLVAGRPQVDADDLLRAAEEMHVGIVESREDEPTARIDDLRLFSGKRLNVGRGADFGDALAAHGNGLCLRSLPINRVYLGVDDDDVGHACLRGQGKRD